MATSCTIVITQATPQGAISVAVAAAPSWSVVIPAGQHQIKNLIHKLESVIASELSME